LATRKAAAAAWAIGDHRPTSTSRRGVARPGRVRRSGSWLAGFRRA